jgi:hypothetical protein
VNLTLSDNTHSVGNAESRIALEAIALDQALLDRPQSAEIQLDLFGDYKATWRCIRASGSTSAPIAARLWLSGGKNDPATGSSKQNTHHSSQR